MIDRDPGHLHPRMREAVSKVLAACAAAGLPFAMFEGFRSRERQAALYAQGRTTDGPIVTYATPGQSYHQYGLAADIVGYLNGQWTWDLPTTQWTRLHVIGMSCGLETLSFETPHLQVAGLKIGDLMAGRIPDDGGDPTYREVLEIPAPAGAAVPIAVPRLPTAPKVLSDDDLAAMVARGSDNSPNG